jgi:solute carrier family 8 (sodium/calcium exchanger)
MNLLSPSTMGAIYLITLFYLFLGISIIADVFMEAIEVICSKTKSVEVSDKDGKRYTYDVPIWNGTIANLTLMALGSSAPEILLSVIETLNTLGSLPGELGIFSIVGSAAFNLLAISAVCIICVEGDEPKKIYDLGVFAVTASFSMFAYIWMYIVLLDEEVTLAEAWLTFAFFFILIIISYGADRFKDW